MGPKSQSHPTGHSLFSFLFFFFPFLLHFSFFLLSSLSVPLFVLLQSKKLILTDHLHAQQRSGRSIEIGIHSNDSIWNRCCRCREQLRWKLVFFFFFLFFLFFFFFFSFLWCIINKYEWSFEFGVMSCFRWC